MLNHVLLQTAMKMPAVAARRGFLTAMALAGLASVARAETSRVEQSFDAQGIQRVVLRAANADKAKVVRTESKRITIAGQVAGGAQGYHAPDPNLKETPASEWGMRFVSQQFGPVLVVSSQNETGYIHHFYTIDTITVTVPNGVDVVLETRALSGSGAPDLRAP